MLLIIGPPIPLVANEDGKETGRLPGATKITELVFGSKLLPMNQVFPYSDWGRVSLLSSAFISGREPKKLCVPLRLVRLCVPGTVDG